jgi:hypothetical protein
VKFTYFHTIYSRRGDRLGLVGKAGATAESVEAALAQVLEAERRLRTGPMFRGIPVRIETEMKWTTSP